MVDGDFHFAGGYDDDKVVLGKLLFYDKILSGNLNMSCGSCHHGLLRGVDGLPLAIGEGATGLGTVRNLGAAADAVPGRVPRHTMPLYNLGHKSLTAAFHDGRVEVDPQQPSGYATPAGNDLPLYVDTVMAAQAFFPVAESTEMAGQAGENAQADLAAASDLPAVWEHIAAKIRNVPEYVARFAVVYRPALEPNIPVTQASDISYVHVANAIFAWEASTFRSQNTPYDRFLAGDRKSLSRSAKKGLKLFFGRAGCGECHAGVLLTDNEFHSIALPQIGPGKGDGADGHDDYGRERVTGNPADRYRFRTSPLRNVALTAPYGHDGAFRDLESMLRHHFDATASLNSYDQSQVVLPSRPDLDALDFIVMNDPARVAAIAAMNDVAPLQRPLSDEEIAYLMDFLVQALTDPDMLDARESVPPTVPSGLPVAD
jgi:cytochrome c peroxidase